MSADVTELTIDRERATKTINSETFDQVALIFSTGGNMLEPHVKQKTLS